MIQFSYIVLTKRLQHCLSDEKYINPPRGIPPTTKPATNHLRPLFKETVKMCLSNTRNFLRYHEDKRLSLVMRQKMLIFVA